MTYRVVNYQVVMATGPWTKEDEILPISYVLGRFVRG